MCVFLKNVKDKLQNFTNLLSFAPQVCLAIFNFEDDSRIGKYITNKQHVLHDIERI